MTWEEYRKTLIVSNMRVVLTEKCQADCPHCFNSMYRKTDDIDDKKLFEFFQKNLGKLPVHFQAMGGEPTLHPNFKSIIQGSLKYFQFARVFTNGLDMRIVEDCVHPVTRIGWIFNGLTAQPKKLHELFKKAPCRMIFYVVYRPETSKKMLEKIKTIVSLFKPGEISITLSADTTNPGFFQKEFFKKGSLQEYRKGFVAFLKEAFIAGSGGYVNPTLDHSLPTCFFDDIEISDVYEQAGISYNANCKRCPSRLIKTDFGVYYCNQVNIKVCDLFEDGKPVTIDHIEKMTDGTVRKRAELMEVKHCEGCKVKKLCLGGCSFNALMRLENKDGF